MQGEISALINLARTLGGFSVAYFQVPWATKHGALQTFGVEAAIVTGLFFLIIPALQYRGRDLRVSCFRDDSQDHFIDFFFAAPILLMKRFVDSIGCLRCLTSIIRSYGCSYLNLVVSVREYVDTGLVIT